MSNSHVYNGLAQCSAAGLILIPIQVAISASAVPSLTSVPKGAKKFISVPGSMTAGVLPITISDKYVSILNVQAMVQGADNTTTVYEPQIGTIVPAASKNSTVVNIVFLNNSVASQVAANPTAALTLHVLLVASLSERDK